MLTKVLLVEYQVDLCHRGASNPASQSAIEPGAANAEEGRQLAQQQVGRAEPGWIVLRGEC